MAGDNVPAGSMKRPPASGGDSSLESGDRTALFTMPVSAAVARLGTDAAGGLSAGEAARRLVKCGRNEFQAVPRGQWFTILVSQFQSSVIYLLVVATALSLLGREFMQACGIAAALLINAAVGFATEMRAKLSLESLSRLAGGLVRTRRGGVEVELPASELVPGDIILLGAGCRVPADARIVECASLSVDESAMTGESVPVYKESEAGGEEQLSTALWQGTLVASGRATALVVATGRGTRLGRLGRLVVVTGPGATPLAEQLERLGVQLTHLTIVICAIVSVIGLIKQYPLMRMVETGIALAVAAIPEGLPVTATLALAYGITEMVRNKALVRRLPAVETLGCTSVICTDKTGTLTENKMNVTEVVTRDTVLVLTGRGYEPVGELKVNGGDGGDGGKRLSPSVVQLLNAAVLCNDARLEQHEGEDWHVHGDPTEGALLVAARKTGIDEDELRARRPRLAELPLDLARKRMATIDASPGTGSPTVSVKGSPGTVLPACTTILVGTQVVPLTEAEREWFLAENRRLAARGLRVLGFATRRIDAVPATPSAAEVERGLTLLGLTGIADMPRENVCQAVKECQDAGIRVIMLTGDQTTTAQAIAQELGIHSPGTGKPDVLTGAELSELSPDELEERMQRISVLSRVTPEMKLEVVKYLQTRGEVVAMTGDGINDAPALKQSNIGVAMGLKGTDLAREAADLVITDDNFSTIVKAIEQGRFTYERIKRSVAYLLTASVASVTAIALGILTGNEGLFLKPLQLLYLNLIMHIFPSLGIVLQQGSPEVMRQQPRKRSEHILGPDVLYQITFRGLIVAVVAYLVAASRPAGAGGAALSNTLVLSVLSVSLVLQSWCWLRAGGASSRRGGLRPSLPMFFTSLLALALLAGGVYWRPLARVLSMTSPGGQDLWLVLTCAIGCLLLTTLFDAATRIVGDRSGGS